MHFHVLLGELVHTDHIVVVGLRVAADGSTFIFLFGTSEENYVLLGQTRKLLILRRERLEGHKGLDGSLGPAEPLACLHIAEAFEGG